MATMSIVPARPAATAAAFSPSGCQSRFVPGQASSTGNEISVPSTVVERSRSAMYVAALGRNNTSSNNLAFSDKVFCLGSIGSTIRLNSTAGRRRRACTSASSRLAKIGLVGTSRSLGDRRVRSSVSVSLVVVRTSEGGVEPEFDVPRGNHCASARGSTGPVQ